MIDQGRTSNVVNIHYEKEELEGEILWDPAGGATRPWQRVPATSLARCHIMSSKTCPWFLIKQQIIDFFFNVVAFNALVEAPV